MVFKKLLGSLGVGGPTVDTVLDAGPVRPGGRLTGQVHLQGGNADFDIEHITLELVARVEAEHDDGESEGVVVFDRFTVGGGFRLARGRAAERPLHRGAALGDAHHRTVRAGAWASSSACGPSCRWPAPRTRATWTR